MMRGRVGAEVYTVVVDCGKSVEKLVKEMARSGRCDWIDGDISSKNFPVKRIGKKKKAMVGVELIYYDGYIHADAVIQDLDGMGYRPAGSHEFLAFLVKYLSVPEAEETPIIALGSMWPHNGLHRVLCFSRRSLSLEWIEVPWSVPCRFTAIRHQVVL